MRIVKQPDVEPIPGYRLLEPLGTGGYGEVWKCEAPGGLLKAIKFVYGTQDHLDGGAAPAEEEREAIERVKAIRHPFLLSMERVERIGSELVIVMELADKNLHDLLTECREWGREGLAREELLGYLREAAEALDLMNLQHNLQHLDIKPRNLFLVSNHVKVGDFGLVNSSGSSTSHRPPAVKLGAITPLYASPEVFQGTLSQQSDQYSLAIVYQELLTGTLPFQGKNARQMLLQHTTAEPDLGPLPAADRPIVARALAKKPAERFPSCMDFVRALIYGQVQAPVQSAEGSGFLTSALEGAETPVAEEPQASSQTSQTSKDVPEAETIPAHKADLICVADSGPGTTETLAVYKFLKRLSCTPLTEVWKVQAPDGSRRLVKYVYGFGSRDPQQDWETIQCLRAIRHPSLLPARVAESDPGRLVLVTALVEKTLRDRLQECQARGQPGVPRTELLGYLRAAAEALDYLYQRHAVQHLSLNPRNLLLANNGRLLIADFGLMQLLWLPTGQPEAKLNARYTAPELFGGQPSPGCDQYSLALIYHELLTGGTAHRGRKRQALPGGRTRDFPDLDGLPAGDRDIIARALDVDPRKRWPTCTDMIRALETAGQGGTGEPDGDRPALPTPAVLREGNGATNGHSAPHAALAERTSPVAPDWAIQVLPHHGPVLQGHFNAPLLPGLARHRLEGFRYQWNALNAGEDRDAYVYRVHILGSLWQRCIGRQPGLEVRIRLIREALDPANGPSSEARGPAGKHLPVVAPVPSEVLVQIRPLECGKDQGSQLLKEMGPLLYDSVKAHLQVNSKRRRQERLLWPYALEVCPVVSPGELGGIIKCQGKDISLNGIGFYLPQELATTQVSLSLPMTPHTPQVTTLANIVRVQRCGDGWYEAGAVLLQAAAGTPKPEEAAVTADC